MTEASQPLVSAQVLIVDDEDSIRKLVGGALRRAGYDVVEASDGEEALARIAEVTPDLVVSDVMMPTIDGFMLVSQLRADPVMRSIPVILLTAKGETDDVITGLQLGADDYLAKPFKVNELLARVRAKIERPPVPSDELPRNRQTNFLTERLLARELQYELDRSARSRAPGVAVVIALNEINQIQAQFGRRGAAQVAKQAAALIQQHLEPLDIAGSDTQDRILLVLPETSPEAAQRRLEGMARALVARQFTAGDEHVYVTPTIGYAPFATDVSAEALLERARIAATYSALHLDLQPAMFTASMEAVVDAAQGKGAHGLRAIIRRFRTALQIAAVLVIGLVVPFIFYAIAPMFGIDLAWIMYLVVVIALLVTAYFIWVEGFYAMRPLKPFDRPGAPYPPATAIIAAYLPNEAATIVETVEAFLRVEYPSSLQVLLAYNTPKDHPIEAKLHQIAKEDPRFTPYRVMNSTSKAQNVNSALAESEGEFIGVFDADHHPAPDSFVRAWHWLSNGFDVVQGHCLVRNGDTSWVARTVAVEFEAIYAVSHPGRARLHDFGIFGGSNGYWRADLLRRIRMRGSMLTEDIDSSMRVIESGGKIVSDPFLVSRELAPTTLSALWHQRMRWAQGWFQVARRHVVQGLRSPHLSARQKIGLWYLLMWREVYPWISLQMFPIVAYWAWEAGGVLKLDWFVRLFIVTSLFTLSTGPGQTLFAYLLAAPDIRQHPRWFVAYLMVSSLFYTEFKNTISRVAQLKELSRERQWKVTPRSAEASEASG